LLRNITVARIFWLSQSEERKNSAKPKKWPSMIKNVSLVNRQTDRLALPYDYASLMVINYHRFFHSCVYILSSREAGVQEQGRRRQHEHRNGR
jgi:hypothetical protein